MSRESLRSGKRVVRRTYNTVALVVFSVSIEGHDEGIVRRPSGRARVLVDVVRTAVRHRRIAGEVTHVCALQFMGVPLKVVKVDEKGQLPSKMDVEVDKDPEDQESFTAGHFETWSVVENTLK